MTLPDILDGVSKLGTLGLALLALYAFLTERIVPRGRLDEVRADKQEALELARAASTATERLADAVEARNKLEAERRAEERMR